MHDPKKHYNIRSQTLIDANKINGIKLWPNPVGLGFQGEVVKEYRRGQDRYIVMKNPRPVKFGLAKGSADTIGFKTETVEGFKIPRFLSIEIKAGNDRLKPEQRNWREMVLESGGIAGVVRSPADLNRILSIPLIT